MISQSTICSLFVFAISLKCSIAGNMKAKGAQSRAPIRPKNLSRISARNTASIEALTTTKNLERFLAHLRPVDALAGKNQFSRMVLVGLIIIAYEKIKFIQKQILIIITRVFSAGNISVIIG